MRPFPALIALHHTLNVHEVTTEPVRQPTTLELCSPNMRVNLHRGISWPKNSIGTAKEKETLGLRCSLRSKYVLQNGCGGYRKLPDDVGAKHALSSL